MSASPVLFDGVVEPRFWQEKLEIHITLLPWRKERLWLKLPSLQPSL